MTLIALASGQRTRSRVSTPVQVLTNTQVPNNVPNNFANLPLVTVPPNINQGLYGRTVTNGSLSLLKTYRNSSPNFSIDPPGCVNDKIQIRSPDAPPLTPKDTWSEGIRVGNILYISGKLPTTWPSFELIPDRSLDAQVQQVFENLAAVAEAAGGCLDNVVKLTIFINEASGFSFDATAEAMSRGLER